MYRRATAGRLSPEDASRQAASGRRGLGTEATCRDAAPRPRLVTRRRRGGGTPLRHAWDMAWAQWACGISKDLGRLSTSPTDSPRDIARTDGPI